MTDFGPGSQEQQFPFTPGYAYAGDAWCFACNAYVPSEAPPGGPPRYAQHGTCPGSLRATTRVEQGRDAF